MREPDYLGYSVIVSDSGSVQRSFRLSAATSELLDRLADASTESRNALADRLLGQALRTERHPLIRFRIGAAGRREPCLVGTRLLVRQVVAQIRAEDGPDPVAVVAEDLGLPIASVRACVSYQAEFADEIEDDIAWARAVEDSERARWEREQRALA